MIIDEFVLNPFRSIRRVWFIPELRLPRRRTLRPPAPLPPFLFGPLAQPTNQRCSRSCSPSLAAMRSGRGGSSSTTFTISPMPSRIKLEHRENRELLQVVVVKNYSRRLLTSLTYVLMTYGMLKVQLMVGHYLFILAERKRWIAKYKIQKDKYMPDELVDKMWKANYGTDFILPFFIVALPMSLSDYALQRFAGLDIRDRSQGWTELAWKMPIAVFIWDLIIWVAHVAFHKVPGWYKRFHAYHHEHQYPNVRRILGKQGTPVVDSNLQVLAASQFSLIDAIWETTAPVYIGCAMTGMSLFGCYFFQGVFLFWGEFVLRMGRTGLSLIRPAVVNVFLVGLHNHSGYDMPYDFLNKIFRYVDK